MKKIFFSLMAIILMPVFSNAQIDQIVEKDPQPIIKKQGGFAYSLVETGSGLGGFYEVPYHKSFHVGATFDVLMLRDKNQIDLVDPYTGYPIQIGKTNNVYLLHLMGTVKWRLFSEEFDDSFRPFVFAGAGPVFGMNFPEKNNKIQTKDQYLWTLGGIFGVGLDADTEGKYFMGFKAQYRILPFTQKLGEQKNHSMFDIQLEFGKRF